MRIMTGRDTKAEDEWINHIGNGWIPSEMAVTNMVRDSAPPSGAEPSRQQETRPWQGSQMRNWIGDNGGLARMVYGFCLHVYTFEC